jgi:cell wall-associated NlpC family hydrolase
MPPWIADYVGLPYDETALTCWALIVRIYREQFGIELDAHAGTPPADLYATWADADAERGTAQWTQVVSERDAKLGDVVLLRPLGRMHVGMIVERGRFLHVINNRTSSIERVQLWRPRIVGMFRHAALERETA